MSEAEEKNNNRPGEDEGVPTASFRYSTPWRACLGEAARLGGARRSTEPRRAKLPRKEATKE